MGSMAPNDLEACRNVVKLLTSPKHKNKNHLFLLPFDLAQVPGYMDVVTKVMDLQTLSQNLEAGEYTDQEAFFKDCFVIFENAVAYHSTRSTKWIAKNAKDLLRIAKKQQQKLRGNGASGTGGESAGGKKSSVGLLPTKKNKQLLSEGAPKLKLKIGGPSTGKAAASAAAAPVPASTKPKLSLKLNRPSQGKVPPPGVQTTSGSSSPNTAMGEGERKPKKPRLTLKLGKSKDTEKTEKPAGASTTPKLTISSSKSTSPKLTISSKPKSTTNTEKSSNAVVGGGGSRGKELPEGVAPPKPKPEPKKVTKKTTTKKTTVKAKAKTDGDTKTKGGAKSKTTKTKAKGKLTLKASISSSAASGQGQIPMTMSRKAQASKVLSGLKRRQYKNIGWFTQPVNDKAIIQDYRSKIKHPMDLNTMQSKLDKDEYKTLGAFVLDLRRIFANCLKYNTSIKDGLRPVAMETLETAEQVMTVFLAKPEHPTQVYPPLLFCWKLCMEVVLDNLMNLRNPTDGQPTAYYFLHPVSVYCGGQFPPDYLQKVTKPMDFGTVTAKLVEGQYSRVEDFQSDCKLVLENCVAYYGGTEDGKVFVEQASRLKGVLQQQLNMLNRYLQSPAGQLAQKQAQMQVTVSSFPKPPIPLMLGIIEELRALKYTDKMTKVRGL